LSYKDHIAKIAHTCRLALHSIRKIRKIMQHNSSSKPL